MNDFIINILWQVVITYPLVVFYLASRGKEGVWKKGLILVAAGLIPVVLNMAFGIVGSLIGLLLFLGVIASILEESLVDAFVFLIMLAVVETVIFGVLYYVVFAQ